MNCRFGELTSHCNISFDANINFPGSQIENYYYDHVSKLDFSNSKNFDGFVNIPDAVTSCKYTFFNCTNFNTAPRLSNNCPWFIGTFQNCRKFNKPVTIPDSAIVCAAMFTNCRNFNSPVTFPQSFKWDNNIRSDVSHITDPDDGYASYYGTDLAGMFAYCTNFDQPVSIDIDGMKNGGVRSKVSLAQMFRDCYNFDSMVTVYVSNARDVDMSYMFMNCNEFGSRIVWGFDNCNNINLSHMFDGVDEYHSDIYAPDGAIVGEIFSGMNRYHRTISVPHEIKDGLDNPRTPYYLGMRSPSAAWYGTVVECRDGNTYECIMNRYDNGQIYYTWLIS